MRNVASVIVNYANYCKENLEYNYSRFIFPKIYGVQYNQAIQSQQSNTPWTIRYAIYPCPHCGHYKVRCANWEDKRLSVAFWGAASSKIGKTYKCEHCKRMW